MKNIIKISLFTFLSFFANVSGSENSGNEFVIYLIKSAWHVGILLSNDTLTVSGIRVLSEFRDYKFIDFGWGDADFYQSDDINYYYAVKAALFPTSSVVKVTGHKADLNSIIRWSDFAVKVKLETNQYMRLLQFIDKSFEFENESVIETSVKADGAIKFYKSVHSYSLVYTCNTWVADALEHAGLDIDPDEIITSDQLYIHLVVLGEVLK